MEEWLNTLRAFSVQAKKFDQHMNFFQNIKAEMNFRTNHEANVTISGVNEESLISVLVRFRNFYMKKNKLYFVRILEGILNNPTHKKHWQLTKDFLSVWNKLLDPHYDSFGGMFLKISNDSLSVKRNLDLWMNEEYLHVDQYKAGSYRGLDAIKSQHVFESLSKISFVDTLQRLCALIIAFNAQVVDKILEDINH